MWITLLRNSMGNGLDFSFASEVDAVQRLGGKVEIRKVKMGHFDAIEWLGAMRTGCISYS